MFNSSGRPVKGANGKVALMFGGEPGKDSRLTTSEVDITPSEGDLAASGATFEITVMRNSPVKSETYGPKSTKNKTKAEPAPTIELQFRLADMKGEWKSVSEVGDIENKLERQKSGTLDMSMLNRTIGAFKTYKYSNDGGITYQDKSY